MDLQDGAHQVNQTSTTSFKSTWQPYASYALWQPKGSQMALTQPATNFPILLMVSTGMYIRKKTLTRYRNLKNLFTPTSGYLENEV